jgi:hypothetical protein
MDRATEELQEFMLGKHSKLDFVPVAVVLSGQL